MDTRDIPTLWMVRHGPTSFNSKSNERIRSWMDVPLSREGVRLAWDAARFFFNRNAEKVISSDLERARVTAEKIAEENYLPIELTKELRDWNVGELCGLLVKDAIPQLNYYTDNPREEVPGGESFRKYLSRFEGIFERLLMHTQSKPTEPLILVTHSRNFGAAHAWLTGDISAYKKPHSLPPGGVMAYRLEKGSWHEEALWPGDEQNSPAPQELEEN